MSFRLIYLSLRVGSQKVNIIRDHLKKTTERFLDWLSFLIKHVICTLGICKIFHVFGGFQNLWYLWIFTHKFPPTYCLKLKFQPIDASRILIRNKTKPESILQNKPIVSQSKSALNCKPANTIIKSLKLKWIPFESITYGQYETLAVEAGVPQGPKPEPAVTESLTNRPA